MAELTELGVSEAARRIRSGEISALELVEAHLRAAERGSDAPQCLHRGYPRSGSRFGCRRR